MQLDVGIREIGEVSNSPWQHCLRWLLWTGRWMTAKTTWVRCSGLSKRFTRPIYISWKLYNQIKSNVGFLLHLFSPDLSFSHVGVAPRARASDSWLDVDCCMFANNALVDFCDPVQWSESSWSSHYLKFDRLWPVPGFVENDQAAS